MQSLFVLGAAAVGMANAINVPRGYYGGSYGGSYGGNSTTTSSTEEMTTSTVYATSVHTITKCPPEVTNCPVGHVTTETIPVFTTYCPVTAVITVPSGSTKPVEVTTPHETKTKPVESTSSSTEMTTSTVYTTSVHTITKCPPEVPNCPVGHVTTETIAVSTTVCPVTEAHPKPTEEKPTEVKPTSPVETTPSPVKPPHYGNSTTQYTTSTIYTTNVHTITKCPPEVPNCPVGHTTTETVPVSTTVCPVTETHPIVVPQPSKPVETQPSPIKPPYYGNSTTQYTTSTIYTTNVQTVTKCPPEVPNCPVGHTTTQTYAVSTTVCPVTETHPIVVPQPSKPVETQPSVVVPPQPSKPVETQPSVVPPQPSQPSQPSYSQPTVPAPQPSKPSVPAPSKPGVPVPTTPTPETPVVTGAAGRMGLDVAAVIAGAAVFLL